MKKSVAHAPKPLPLATQPPSDKCHGLQPQSFAQHQHACEEMIALRKRGTPAHLERHVDASGEHVDVIKDDDHERQCQHVD